MKKLFLITLAVLFFAGAAYATNVEFGGAYYVRGSYISNEDGLSCEDTANYMYYDMDLDLDVNFIVNDNTKIITYSEIHDENYNEAGGTDGRDVEDGRDLDDNIEIKRVFASHKFGTGTTVDFGLMTGTAWAYSFGDTATGRYRVKVAQPMPFGLVVGLVEKRAESGTSGIKDDEKDDGDLYALAAVTKLGDINFKPLFVYYDGSQVINDEDSDGLKLTVLDVGFDGSFGAIGFESELIYKNWNQDWDGGEDYITYGLYFNAWTNIDAFKVGAQLAYGSWDDDAGAGFNMGDDYEPLTFASNQAGFGNTADEFDAVTLLVVYADFALNDEMTLNGAIGYWMSNANENADGTDNFWKDASGYELDAGFTWKLSDAVNYTVQGALAQYNLDEDAAGYDDADSAVRIYHRMQVKF
jgi:hypothetical protein